MVDKKHSDIPLYQPARKLTGSLEVICGSMFAGKTGELMRRLMRAEYARKRVLTIKHLVDQRSMHQCILSHDGVERSAHAVDNSPAGMKTILSLATTDIDVIGIDEVQFFPLDIITVIMHLVEQGKKVVVSGLDLDFRGEPFGVMPILMACADSVTKLNAVCMRCGESAHFSQRLIDGSPANYDDPIVLIGAAEKYESRCRSCFIINKRPLSSTAKL